jgi:ProP effector
MIQKNLPPRPVMGNAAAEKAKASDTGSLCTNKHSEAQGPNQAQRRAKAATATIAVLAEFFPRTFSVYERRRKPLKLGIDQDIASALNGAATPGELAAALRHYTGNVFYLRALVAGAERIDLHGRPVGVVTNEDEAHAKQRLLAARQQREQRRAARKQVKPTPPTPTAKGDGLESLRAAWRKRKEQEP